MKIWKNLFGRGDKIHADEIAVAPGLLLGGAVIVESGSNANGEYRRWGDGTQICWGETSFDTAMTSPPSSALGNTGNRNITMPIEFAEPPISKVFISGKTERANVFTMGANSPNTVDTIRFRFASLLPESATMTYYVHYIAIGRWK